MSFLVKLVGGIVLSLLASAALHLQDAHGRSRWPFEYKEYGVRDVGKETIVVIPGLDGCTSFFSDVLPELTVHRHVVMFYLPLAPVPLDHSELPYSFDLIVNKLRDVIDELGLSKVHLLGESFGGAVAQHFMLAAPEKVETLTIISSLCRTEVTPVVKFKLNFLLPVVTVIGNLFPGLAQHLFALAHVDDVVEQFEPTWIKDFFIKEASWAHHYSVIARIKIILRLDICSKVRNLTQRALVVYGESDNFTKAGSLELHENLPNSELRALPGGHLPHLTSPRAFSSIMNSFLDGSGRTKER